MPSTRFRLLAAIVGALALAPAAAAAPIDNEAALWANPETRYVIVGETHGTAETPAFFGDLACDAHASGRPIVAAVEVGERSQVAIDAFLASDGGPAARTQFLADPHWNPPFEDGRSSRAYFALFDRLRGCLRAGKLASVAAIQPSGAPDWTANDSNAAMATLLERAAALRKNALVVVLVGNVHAAKQATRSVAGIITPAAAHLPARETISLRVTTGGEAWICTTATDCGPHPWGDIPAKRRRISLGPGAAYGYDGEVDLGVPTTASPPANSARDQPAANAAG